MNLIYRLFFKIEVSYNRWKKARLRTLLKSCGREFELCDGVCIWSPETMEVGDSCCLRGYTYVYASGGIVFGDRVRIAANCVLTSVSHKLSLDGEKARRPMLSASIHIQDDVWIGANSVICAGVTIGEGTVVGAGSVVTRDIPAGVFAAGAPAEIIRNL